MRDFIIFFSGGEGSSAIICHLKQFINNINILGFEPFDNHTLNKKMSDTDLNNIFRLLFNKKQDHVSAINTIYGKYTDKTLGIDKSKSNGFKMRLQDWNKIKEHIIKNNVIVFVLIRQNVLKWAISKCAPKHASI